MTIQDQVHNKFKVFSGSLAADHTLGALATEVEAYVKQAKIAPKSIGVEYIEHAKRLVVSLGYRSDEAGYAVRLTTQKLGKVSTYGANDLGKLEQAMTAAAAKVPNIICHELYITEDDEFLMVFMTHAA